MKYTAIQQAIDKAKEMEKEQLQDAFRAGIFHERNS